jgi:Flp pilus assembly protein TadD
VAVVAVGLGLRIAHLADSSDSPFFTRPVIDGQAYDQWAIAIRSGHAPDRPFYQDPLYPYMLAAVYGVFGHRYTAVYVLQIVFGIAFILLAFDTARLLFDRRAGLVAALIAALYEPFIFYEIQIEKTTLAVLLVGLLVWTVIRSARSRHPAWPLCSGICLGLAALTRANLLLFAPLLPVFYLVGRKRTRQGLLAAGLSLAGILAIIAPVSIRNSLKAGEFVLTTTQAGQNLYIGNGPYNRTGQYEAPPWVRPNPVYEEVDFAEHAREQSGQELGYAEKSRFYIRLAIDWAREHPADFLRLLFRKTVLYLNNFEVPDNQDIGFFSRYSWVLRLPLLGFGVLFGLGFAGLILCFRSSRNHLALAILFKGYSLSVVLFFVLARYRLPGLPALLPFAGGMATWLFDRFREKKYRPALGGTALCALCLAVALYPIPRGPRRSEDAQSLVNLGSALYYEGDTSGAINAFQEALRTSPEHGEALRNLGVLMLERGRTSEAASILARAAKAAPDNPATRLHLGTALESQGKLDSALTQYQLSVRLKPGEVRYRFSLATALQKFGRYDAALAQYDTMLELAPDNPLVHHNLAVALYNTGDIQRAWAELQQAKKLGGPVNPNLEQVLIQRLGRTP